MEAHLNIAAWVNQSTIYEVNIRQYTREGTFSAFVNHIPRLKDMGVTVLWLMPITPISEKLIKGSLGSYYACSSYTKINPAFGNESDLLNLIRCAHEYDMKVIIDWVANHTGANHEWMDHHPDWFTRDAAGNFIERNGWEDVVDLNYENKDMRAALIGAMQYWVRNFNIDGFRCDMAHLVPLDFWKKARTTCDAIKPLFWLAECDHVNYHPTFDASYAWGWMHTSERLTKGEASLHDLFTTLQDYAQYPAGALKLFYTSNHDENSWNGTEYEKYGIAAKPWAVFTFTWKGMPLIYSGQELPNHKRLQFFEKDLIEWNSPPALHDFYKALNKLRKDHPVIINGSTLNLPSSHPGALAYMRMDEKETVLVVLNVSMQAIKMECAHEKLIGTFTQLFSGMTYQFNKAIPFELMPGDYFVYVKQASALNTNSF